MALGESRDGPRLRDLAGERKFRFGCQEGSIPLATGQWIHDRRRGTEVRDLVCYHVPGGQVVGRLSIRRNLRGIFESRSRGFREPSAPRPR